MTVKTILQDRLTYLRELADGGDTLAKAVVALFDTDLSTMFAIAAPAAAGVNVHAAIAANNSTSTFTTALTNPVYPRNLKVVFASSWDGGDVTVIGTDQFGVAVTETFTTGSGVTRTGSKTFATVTSIAKASVGATANTATVETADKLSIPFKVTSTLGMAGDDGSGHHVAVITVDKTNNNFTPENVADGTLNYTVQVQV